MEQLNERSIPVAVQDTSAPVADNAEALRLDGIKARGRNRRFQHVLDFAIIGTVGLLIAAAGLESLVKAVSG